MENVNHAFEQQWVCSSTFTKVWFLQFLLPLEPVKMYNVKVNWLYMAYCYHGRSWISNGFSHMFQYFMINSTQSPDDIKVNSYRFINYSICLKCFFVISADSWKEWKESSYFKKRHTDSGIRFISVWISLKKSLLQTQSV